ncbi:hypothetical protein LCGC14_1291380 [marine sediment metagenome]|uniref:Uncharacterized protein n=1 Tax=marine sediment metagenome TaxID=412755 RepID=A0A0F9KSE9_9ZZZZ
MSLTCTRCEGSGFLNLLSIDVSEEPEGVDFGDFDAMLAWIAEHEESDIAVCDCCGDGEAEWYGVPGEHYNPDDPPGPDGPYAPNGGLAKCH